MECDECGNDGVVFVLASPNPDLDDTSDFIRVCSYECALLALDAELTRYFFHDPIKIGTSLDLAAQRERMATA